MNVITCFNGVTLAVGGDLETYWKSTVASTVQPTASLSPYRSSGITSAQTSPSAHSISGAGSQSLTISSLKGRYLYVVVQVTRDSVPVVFPQWRLPESNFSLAVCDVTLDQFDKLAERLGRNVDASKLPLVTDWHTFISHHMMSLSQLLAVNSFICPPSKILTDNYSKILPAGMGVCMELAFPSTTIRDRHCLGVPKLNVFVDAVLRTIYNTRTSDGPYTRRRIMFTSYSPDVCSAINWKQPNCEFSISLTSPPASESCQIRSSSHLTAEKRTFPSRVHPPSHQRKMQRSFAALETLWNSLARIIYWAYSWMLIYS